jgi:hypothetical protein
MKKADLVSAAVVAAFGLLLLLVIIPGWVPRHEEGGYGLGAQVMPRVTATLVTVLAALFFVSRLIGRGERPEQARKEDAAAPIPRSSWLFLAAVSLFAVAVTAIFAWIGFLAAGPLTIAGFMIFMGERRPVPIVATSVIAAAVIWLFFWQLLRFPLP